MSTHVRSSIYSMTTVFFSMTTVFFSMTTVILQELSQREGLTNQLQQPNNKMALYKYKYENSHRNIELY